MATTQTALTNHDRVGKGLKIVQEALGPFVHRELSRAFGGGWWTRGVLDILSSQQRRQLPAAGNNKELVNDLDIAALLGVMERRWGDVFTTKLSRTARTRVIELIDWRNEWAHVKSGDMSDDDAWRALDTMTRLLEVVQPAAARETEALARSVRDAAAPPQPAPPIEPPAVKARVPAAATQNAMEFHLRPWRDVVAPHSDVARGKYRQAEFAADLSQVLAGKAEAEYQDPTEFFARTYLTEGMKNLLVAALERLAGEGGEPVIQLKTAFGGGKTHSMLALYHLLRGRTKLEKNPAIAELVQRAGVKTLPKARVAVLVGTALDPSQPHLDAAGNGIEVRTLWGEMAAQLGGKDGYALVRTADEGGVAPGSDVLVELFDRFGPCVVFIDELVAYARNIYGVSGLPSGSFESLLTFVQSLTEAAKRSKRSMVVASIPESDMEAGGEAGKIALAKIDNTFGRIEAVWKPVGAEEGFEIVRRRLFGQVTDPPALEQVCLAYSRLYGGGNGDFPRECGEASYLDRLRAAYPIHPEVFDRLYDDWNSLERFQRTRGVLRLLAACIHELWTAGDRSLLIAPGSLPLRNPRVRDELLRYLPEGWNTVIDREVDGDRSEPYRVDRENVRFGQLVAAERVARTIFLGSAPDVAQQRIRGIEDVRIRLGVAQPGESIAIFNDALGRLTDRLSYLYSGNHRYWYDTRPNLRRTAEDRASRYDPYEVHAEIERRLRRDRSRGEFAGVHWCPDESGADVPDEQTARLVVLRPAHVYSRSRNDAPALPVAGKILQNRGPGSRRYPNMLVFLASEEDAMSALESEVRRFLAWQSIDEEKEALNLDAHQRKEATDAKKRSDETVNLRLGEAYTRLLVPVQDLEGPWRFEEHSLRGGEGGLVARASQQVTRSGELVIAWSPVLLKRELDRVLWKDVPVLDTRRLWEYLCTYGYLPRLRDESVLRQTVAEGLRSKDYFAYAGSIAGDRYEGLIFGAATLPTSIHLDGASVLAKPEIAQAQIDADEAKRREKQPEPPGPGLAPGPGPQPGSVPGPGPQPPAPVVMRRYHGTKQLDPLKVGSSARQIADEIIQHLSSLPAARVRITLEIEADVPDGIPETTIRTVTENGNTLGLESQGFEEG